MTKTNILVSAYTSQEFHHFSYVYAGLSELKALNIIDFEVCFNTSKRLGTTSTKDEVLTFDSKRPQPKTSFYKIKDVSKKKSILIAIDLYDLANQFSTEALETCDMVFKRNYEEKHVSCLPKKQRVKVQKFGLSLPLFSSKPVSQRRVFYGLLINTIVLNTKWNRQLLSRINNTVSINLKEWNYVKTSRQLANFNSLITPKSNVILFQTRCFPHENDEDVKAIHNQRYRIIKYLKDNFPDNFKGGFMPSKISLKKYSDALTNVPTAQRLYMEAVKNAKIVIYTRGLANSPAWKLAEYLAQGKVILAERLTAQLPFLLNHGKELLYFDTLEELSLLVIKTLNDEALRNCLSANARLYYENHIDPSKRMQYVINKALETDVPL